MSERLMIGIAFIALGFSAFSLGLNFFDMYGYEFPKILLYISGVVSWMSMITYLVIGIAILQKIKFN